LVYFIEWEILIIFSCSFIIVLLLDWISLLFISFVLLISSLVIIYRKNYIEIDKNFNRFIYLMILFIFSIILLIIRPNLIRILLGWDGLGLVSFCLVIYFQNIKSLNAGIITALINRAGDVFLLLGIGWIFNKGGWRYYFYLKELTFDFRFLVVIILIILAAITKRAQIPFSAWLPAAIAAPTPVSALVHSSTLVTAGVYLLIRFNFIFINRIFFFFLVLIRGLTIFISGIGAIFEIDLKKIIALSTLSQLGLIIGILSLGNYKLSYFHLLVHALFKALLFLCAGVLIHNLNNFQDIRFSGNSNNQIIVTIICFNISNLALCGIPFLSGFYSKDLILELIIFKNVNLLVIILFLISTGFTIIYSFRLIVNSSLINYLGFRLLIFSDKNWLILKIILILSIFSIFGGRILIWLIFPFPYLIILPIYLKLLVLFLCIFFYFIRYYYYFFKNIYYLIFKKFLFKIYYFFSLIWFLPILITLNLNLFFLNLRFNYLKFLDLGWMEYFGGVRLITYFQFNLIKLNLIINGALKRYFLIFLFIIILIFILF